MEIGNNEEDFLDEVDDFEEEQNSIEDETSINNSVENEETDNSEGQPEEYIDLVSALLKERGIEDKSKIKFENEEGSIEEVDWDSLSDEDKFNVLKSSSEESETGLDDSEIQLINMIRSSKMSPAEYLQYIEQSSVDRYMQNVNNTNYQYSVDQYSDDELFVADFMSRTSDATEEEAMEALTRAKSDETLFNKQIGAIRKEYKTVEDENIQQAQYEQEQQAQEQYEQFANSVVNEINNFTEFSGYDLNMEQDDMQMLYDFITGTDAAGNNHFSKALADPEILVQTAWFALNGKQMINDITDYFQKEITNVRKESYNKGLADAKSKMNKSNVVFKNKSSKSQQSYSDLDDDFI